MGKLFHLSTPHDKRTPADFEYALGWQDVHALQSIARDGVTMGIRSVLEDYPVCFPKIEGISYGTETGSHTYASLVYHNAQSAQAAFDSDVLHPLVYLRDGNPYGKVLERALFSIDPTTELARVTSFGMGAITAALSLVSAGQHIVASKYLFGTTTAKLKGLLRERNISVTFVDSTDPCAWDEATIPGHTAAYFFEPVANPGMQLANTTVLSQIAHQWDIPVIVDNSATPLDHSLTLGADVVAFSTTKFLGMGKHSGGAVLFSREGVARLKRRFPDYPMGYPVLNEIGRSGATQSADAASFMLASIDIAAVRHYRQIETATTLASYVASRFPYPVHSANIRPVCGETQCSQLFAIDLATKDKAFAFINALAAKGIYSVNNFGGPRTSVVHPASTTQRALSEEEQLAQGVGPGLVRVSVGVERPKFLIDTFQKALCL